METTFDALNQGKFVDLTEERIRLLKIKYKKIIIVAGITGLIIGGIIVYECMKDY